MVDKVIDYDEEDLLLMDNPEKTFFKKIRQSTHLSRIILYCGLKFIKEEIPFVTIPDVSKKLNINRDYVFQLFEVLERNGILERKKVQNEKRIRYTLKDENKLKKSIEIIRKDAA